MEVGIHAGSKMLQHSRFFTSRLAFKEVPFLSKTPEMNPICVKKPETLEELKDGLRMAFSEDKVDIDLVNDLLNSYESNPLEWKKYAKFDRYRYTRNLIDEGNGRYNLMLLCWGEGHGSAIHDHADAHCFMKILAGSLSEVRFEWPDENDAITSISQDEYNPMIESGRTLLKTNQVCYINDSLGLHRVENPSSSEPAVSLHLYCPPFQQCHVFNQQTGHKSVSKVTFWSKYGSKPDRKIQDERPPEDN